jgi:2-dehydro-3-deoxyglucarate aldolase/4-hydroxy-2-oxoheptanedioate aldolase
MMVTEIENPAVPIILADAGFDFFTLDMEHGSFDLPTAANILKVARLANITPLVRVPDGWYHLIAPALDAGAMGIIVPRVETREVAERSIAAMRYPPLGLRGVFCGKGNSDYQRPKLLDYTRHANDNTLALIQIESRRAVEHADELLAAPGLDGVMVGPWDLALSLGVDPSDPLVVEMTQKVVEAAKRQNVISGIHIGDPAQIKMWQSRGMTFRSCLTDLEVLRNAAQALCQQLHS